MFGFQNLAADKRYTTNAREDGNKRCPCMERAMRKAVTVLNLRERRDPRVPEGLKIREEQEYLKNVRIKRIR